MDKRESAAEEDEPASVAVVVAEPVRRWAEWTREQGAALTAFGLSAALPAPLLVVGGMMLFPVSVDATVVRVAPTPLVTYLFLGVLHENEVVRLPAGVRVGDRLALSYNQFRQQLYADGRPPDPWLGQLLLVAGVALCLVGLAVAASLVRIPPRVPPTPSVPALPHHHRHKRGSHPVLEQVIDSALWASMR